MIGYLWLQTYLIHYPPPPSRPHHLLHVCEPINVVYMMPQANIGYWTRLNGGNNGEIISGLLLIKTSFYLLIIHNYIYNKCPSYK